MIYKDCKKSIRYNGRHWEHTTYAPRHPAMPEAVEFFTPALPSKAHFSFTCSGIRKVSFHEETGEKQWNVDVQ